MRLTDPTEAALAALGGLPGALWLGLYNHALYGGALNSGYGDWRAAYAIYDVQAQTISIRRLEYDIQTAQDKIRAAGLPSLLADRLALGK